MKKIIFLLTLFLLTGCASQPEMPTPNTETEPIVTETKPPATEATEPPDPLRELLETMTEEEKVGQIFLARFPEENAVEHIRTYHLGGYILFGRDFQDRTPGDIRAVTSNCQSAARIPMLLAVDEEGGTVCRVSAYPAFRWEPYPSPRTLFGQGGMDLVLSMESEKAYLLSSLGLNVNMAPVCDITTASNAFMYKRSLGQDAQTTFDFAAQSAARMDEYHVGAVLKHFPGYGSNGDTHIGSAMDTRTLDQLESADLIPFSAARQHHNAAILMSHNTVTALDPECPVSLSPAAHAYLREEMGFDGVIVTDDLDMDAVRETYGPEESAVLAVLAGNDLLCVTDYPPSTRPFWKLSVADGSPWTCWMPPFTGSSNGKVP